MDQSKVFSQGGEAYPKGGEIPKWIKSTYERRVVNRGRKKKGNHSFRGRPNQHWMVVSIQASVSGSIYQFLQNLFLL